MVEKNSIVRDSRCDEFQPSFKVELPFVWVVSGCMGAGKTGFLLELSKQEKRFGRKKQYFIKPVVDNRVKGFICSRSGEQVFANEFPVDLSEDEFLGYIDAFVKYGIDLVLIDEAQFFGEWIVDFVRELYESGISVYVSGLDLDAFGEPFGFMGELMCLATKVSKLKAQCPLCEEGDRRASITVKRNDSVDLISVGGDEKYTVRCWEHRKEI